MTTEHESKNMEVSVDDIYDTVWNTLDTIQILELQLISRDTGINRTSLEHTINNLTRLLMRLRPRGKLPSVYASEKYDDVASDSDYDGDESDDDELHLE